MQATKDSFFAAMRDRLAEMDATAAVAIGGVARPAVMVEENELPELIGEMTGVYCLRWGAAAATVASRRRVLHAIPVTIEYAVAGSDEASGADRGRQLESMDAKLRQMLAAGTTPKMDYAQSPAASLGTSVLWSAVEFAAAEQQNARLQRQAKVTVYFYPEVTA